MTIEIEIVFLFDPVVCTMGFLFDWWKPVETNIAPLFLNRCPTHGKKIDTKPHQITVFSCQSRFLIGESRYLQFNRWTPRSKLLQEVKTAVNLLKPRLTTTRLTSFYLHCDCLVPVRGSRNTDWPRCLWTQFSERRPRWLRRLLWHVFRWLTVSVYQHGDKKKVFFFTGLSTVID